MDIFLHWISKPCIRKHKNHSKTSSGVKRFVQNLRACKKSQYNVQNWKSWRHSRRHTFRCHKSRNKPESTNISHYGLKVKERKKERKNGKTKTPSHRQWNRMLHAIKHRQNTSVWNSIRIVPPFLPFDGLNLCNDYMFMDSEYNDRYFLHQVDSNTNLLDNVILQQVVMQPTTKPRSVGPYKSRSKTTAYKRNHTSKQEIRECKYITT